MPTLYNKAAALDALGELEACLAALAVDPTFQPALTSREHTRRKLG